MQLALVKGRATATVKHHSLEGRKLLICQMLSRGGEGVGDPVLALDSLGAGMGDRVIITSDGWGLRDLLGHDDSPARWWTLGIVDR